MKTQFNKNKNKNNRKCKNTEIILTMNDEEASERANDALYEIFSHYSKVKIKNNLNKNS